MDIAEFLTARLDEDEEATISGDCKCGEDEPKRPDCSDRILDEVVAKRRIVERHGVVETGMGYEPDDGGTYGSMSNVCLCCGCFDEYAVSYPCGTLKLLALPYADHEEYQSDWAV